jgi:hypothetical protein
MNGMLSGDTTVSNDCQNYQKFRNLGPTIKILNPNQRISDIFMNNISSSDTTSSDDNQEFMNDY